jgi:hypothetical protein
MVVLPVSKGLCAVLCSTALWSVAGFSALQESLLARATLTLTAEFATMSLRICIFG